MRPVFLMFVLNALIAVCVGCPDGAFAFIAGLCVCIFIDQKVGKE